MAANPKSIESMDAEGFRKAVYGAILRELGVAGLARYMTEQLSSERDFTLDRQEWKSDLGVDELLEQIEKLDIESIEALLLDIKPSEVPGEGH